jgi:hypothetical protein
VELFVIEIDDAVELVDDDVVGISKLLDNVEVVEATEELFDGIELVETIDELFDEIEFVETTDELLGDIELVDTRKEAVEAIEELFVKVTDCADVVVGTPELLFE